MLDQVIPASGWQTYRGSGIADKLAVYLNLLLRWNAVINLTSVRTASEIIRRHFAESLSAGLRLSGCTSLLDLGSGAGFPGVPIQLLHPELPVSLVEGHTRKAAFLREVVRELELPTQVLAVRSEGLPDKGFDCVCLRAVDPMRPALAEASRMARGQVMVLGAAVLEKEYRAGLPGWELNGAVFGENAGGSVFLFKRQRST